MSWCNLHVYLRDLKKGYKLGHETGVLSTKVWKAKLENLFFCFWLISLALMKAAFILVAFDILFFTFGIRGWIEYLPNLYCISVRISVDLFLYYYTQSHSKDEERRFVLSNALQPFLIHFLQIKLQPRLISNIHLSYSHQLQQSNSPHRSTTSTTFSNSMGNAFDRLYQPTSHPLIRQLNAGLKRIPKTIHAPSFNLVPRAMHSV